MRRLGITLLALACATTCTSGGKVQSDASFIVRGAVQAPDGAPLAAAPVVLLNQADFGDARFEVALFAGTLGAVCLVPEPPAICSRARRTTTVSDGSYSFHLRGRDTQGSGGNASTFHLATGAPNGGASVSVRFQVQRRELTVPLLKIWAPAFKLTVNRTARAEWEPHQVGDSERVVFFDGVDGETVWMADGRPPLSIDARILEDGRGDAAAEATDTLEEEGATFRLTYRSGRAPFVGGAGPPPSRGGPCTPEPCAVTDGDLGPPAAPVATSQELSVDLGQSRLPTLIVVRGCPSTCGVETSVDGLTFKLVGSVTRPFASITPILSAPVRYVKTTTTGTDLSRLAEVSVWVA